MYRESFDYRNTPSFSGVRVTRSLVLCVCFVDRCLSFCTFSFGHNVVCSAIYGFWLPLRYGEACLKYVVFLDVLICCLYLITNHFIYDVFKLWSVIVYITYLHHLFNWVTYNSWRQITDYSSKSSSTKYLKLIRLHRNIWVSYLRCWKLVFINDIYFNKL